MRSGARPTALDTRDRSYHRSFGTTLPKKFPQYFSVDLGKTMPDQNADGLPFGCTGYTQSDNGGNEDAAIYKPEYLYQKTCLIENHPTDQGCDIRSSLKAAKVYGLQGLAETTDQEAETHRRGPYYNIYDDGGMDWFDSIRTALMDHKVGISAGTPWFPEWEYPQNGIVTQNFVYDGNPDHYNWHNWAIVGFKDIDGWPHLVGKSWQGPGYGDKGFHYLDRATTNKVLEIRGSVTFFTTKATPNDVYTIKVSILETVLDFLYRILGLTRLN